MDFKNWGGSCNGTPGLGGMLGRKASVTRLDETVNYRSTGGNWYGLGGGWANRFSVLWSGYVYMPAKGRYAFCTTSDDGSMLYIGGKLLVNNDGLHGMHRRCAAINANKGYARINIGFFENGGGAGAIAEWMGPGILNGRTRQVIPYDALTT